MALVVFIGAKIFEDKRRLEKLLKPRVKVELAVNVFLNLAWRPEPRADRRLLT